MNFEIEEKTPTKNKKGKIDKKLVFLSLFFLLISIILIIIYINSLINPKETNTKTPIVKQEESKLSIYDEDSNERPLAVMIDNNIGDIKHAGLQDSFVNYELIVEGGLTRIMAIYKDKDVSIIGPVRSSRHNFLDYALEYDAIYAHFGWSPYAEKDIQELNVNNINGMTDPTPYARDSELPSPHNVFTSTTKLENYSETKNYQTTSNNWKNLKYSISKINLDKNIKGESTVNTNLISASKISIGYSNYEYRSYNYDSVNEYYLRSQNGTAHIDRQTNEQLHYKNIIIEKVENTSIDEEDRQDLKTTGTGTGYFITNGYALEINWNKPSRNSKTTYSYKDGSEVILNDGNTFIQIVPIDSNIVIN